MTTQTQTEPGTTRYTIAPPVTVESYRQCWRGVQNRFLETISLQEAKNHCADLAVHTYQRSDGRRVLTMSLRDKPDGVWWRAKAPVLLSLWQEHFPHLDEVRVIAQRAATPAGQASSELEVRASRTRAPNAAKVRAGRSRKELQEHGLVPKDKKDSNPLRQPSHAALPPAQLERLDRIIRETARAYGIPYQEISRRHAAGPLTIPWGVCVYLAYTLVTTDLEQLQLYFVRKTEPLQVYVDSLGRRLLEGGPLAERIRDLLEILKPQD